LLRRAIVTVVVACVMGGGNNRIFQPFQAVNKKRVGNFDASNKGIQNLHLQPALLYINRRGIEFSIVVFGSKSQ